MFGEETELDLVGGDVEECGFWEEELAQYGVKEVVDTGVGDVHEGKRDGEEGDCDAICHTREGTSWGIVL